MPAIQPSILKTQTSQLLDHFSIPTEFIHSFHNLLGFYEDRTRRQNTISNTVRLQQDFKVPRPVLRSVEQALIPRINTFPEEALKLADVLWEENWADARKLAIFILGQTPPKPPKIILDRISVWGAACIETTILQALATHGMESLRHQAETDFFQSLEIWLTFKKHPLRRVGLYAIPTLIAIENFENLPLLFRWVAPLIRGADIEIKDQLSAIVRAMALKSPQETNHFLRKIVISAPNPHTAAIIRQSLDAFPPDQQSSLHQILRQHINKKAPLGN